MAKFTHILLSKTAKEIAGAAYEDLAQDDMFYREWPNQRMYIRKNWQRFVRAARISLSQILEMDYPEEVKTEIYEALLLDRALPPNGDTTVNVPKHVLLH